MGNTMTDDRSAGPNPGELERLWTPWRMRYVSGGAAEAGCLFCNRWAGDDDVSSLLLARGDGAFVIMNLFPYNTGHVMIVPVAHVATPEEADETSLHAMTTLLPPTLRALRRVLNADGFNVGLNVGAVAGAGVAAHLHQHIVPRWLGDANFMPILAATMVLPELIPITYAKLRAELHRELGAESGDVGTATLVVLSSAGDAVLVVPSEKGAVLPTAPTADEVAVWRSARDELAALELITEPIGWAGARQAGHDGPIALTFRHLGGEALGGRWAALASVERELDDPRARMTVAAALAQLAPTLA